MEQENYKFTLELDTDKNGVLDEEEVYQWFLPMNKYMFVHIYFL
jgi:hypothetical protein